MLPSADINVTFLRQICANSKPAVHFLAVDFTHCPLWLSAKGQGQGEGAKMRNVTGPESKLGSYKVSSVTMATRCNSVQTLSLRFKVLPLV